MTRVSVPGQAHTPPIIVRRGVYAVALVLSLAAGVALGAGAVRLAPLGDSRFGTLRTIAIVHTGVFDRPQRTADRSAVTRTGTLVASSFRRLAPVADGDEVLYAARNTAGEYCIVAGELQLQASCTPPAEFARTGVVLNWSLIHVTVNPVIESGYRLDWIEAVWTPDGRVRSTTTVG